MGAMLTAALTAALASACFVYFAWGIAAHFRREGPMPAGMRAIGFANLACFAWFLGGQVAQLRRGAPPRTGAHAASAALAHAASAALMVAAAALFRWTVAVNRARPLTLAFSPDQPSFVQRSGPYAHVRHPFYLSYVVFWAGTALASDSLAHWLAPAILALLYYRAASAEEAKFACSSLAEEYGAYRATTGMLLPLPRWRSPG